MSEPVYRLKDVPQVPTVEPPPVVAAYPRQQVFVPCTLSRGERFVRILDARDPNGRAVVLPASETFVELRCGGRYVRLWAVDEADGLHHVELPNGDAVWINTAAGLIEIRRRAAKLVRAAKVAAKRAKAREAAKDSALAVA